MSLRLAARQRKARVTFHWSPGLSMRIRGLVASLEDERYGLGDFFC
jgi:hypothetical protein